MSPHLPNDRMAIKGDMDSTELGISNRPSIQKYAPGQARDERGRFASGTGLRTSLSNALASRVRGDSEPWEAVRAAISADNGRDFIRELDAIADEPDLEYDRVLSQVSMNAGGEADMLRWNLYGERPRSRVATARREAEPIDLDIDYEGFRASQAWHRQNDPLDPRSLGITG